MDRFTQKFPSPLPFLSLNRLLRAPLHSDTKEAQLSRQLSPLFSNLGDLINLAVGLVLIMVASACSREPVKALQPGFSWAEISADLAYPPFLIDPEIAQFYRQQGLVSRNAGRFGDAIATLKLAVAMDPYSPEGYVILGWTQHLAGYRNFAIQTLQRGLKQAPDHVPSLNALGIVYLVQGELEAAVVTHTRALELRRNNEIAHYNLSLAYERLADFPKAIHHAQNATELEPQNPHPWVALALAHWAAGDTTEAQASYQQSIRLDGRYRHQDYLDHLQEAGFSAEQIQMTDDIRSAGLNP